MSHCLGAAERYSVTSALITSSTGIVDSMEVGFWTIGCGSQLHSARRQARLSY